MVQIAHSFSSHPTPAVVAQRYVFRFILEGKMRLYIRHGAKLIVNQLGCLYRHFRANSDEAACFLICTGQFLNLESALHPTRVQGKGP